jgi:hypothetical protein
VQVSQLDEIIAYLQQNPHPESEVA